MTNSEKELIETCLRADEHDFKYSEDSNAILRAREAVKKERRSPELVEMAKTAYREFERANQRVDALAAKANLSWQELKALIKEDDAKKVEGIPFDDSLSL